MLMRRVLAEAEIVVFQSDVVAEQEARERVSAPFRQ